MSPKRQKRKAAGKSAKRAKSAPPAVTSRETKGPSRSRTPSPLPRGDLTPPAKKQIAIFGAGIAGLTAAHELIERGYQVDVYETKPANPVQERAFNEVCAIGGIARTDWSRLPVYLQPIGFEHDSDALDASGKQIAARLAKTLSRTGENVVEVRGFADNILGDGEPAQAFDPTAPPHAHARIDRRRAWKVAKAIFDAGVGADRLRIRAMGYDDERVWNPNYVAFQMAKGQLLDKIAAQEMPQIRFETLSFHDDDHTDPDNQELPQRAKNQIGNLAAQIKREIERLKQPDLLIEVRGFTQQLLQPDIGLPFDPTVPVPKPARVDLHRAWNVAAELVRHGVHRNNLMLRPMGTGLATDWAQAANDRDYVEFRIVQDVVPGEHGFRFFPSFYRNLFDTMHRTPIADEFVTVYYETPQSVFDNLVETPIQSVGRKNPKASFTFRRQPAASLQEVFELFRDLLEKMDYTVSDIARHQLKLFKYMTSCRERRAQEYEYQSWYDFMDADSFSEGFRRHFDSAGQITMANRASTCDARTYGNVTVQLLLDQLPGDNRTDATLNGPSSLAWFNHWRRYLETQGVQFHQGTLTGFVPSHEGLPWPTVAITRPDRTTPDTVLIRDYYVIAIPVDELQDIVTATDAKHPSLLQGKDFDRIRKLELGDGDVESPDGMLQHLSGIQYFLETDGGFVQGHTNYVDSEWGLSSIAQPQFWLRKRGWWDGYRGVLSVDIGDWETPADIDDTKKSAWNATSDEIANEVWNQVRCTFSDQATIPASFVAYHLDIEEMENGKRDDDDRYLVTRPGEYPTRPGRLQRSAPREFDLSASGRADSDSQNGYEVYPDNNKVYPGNLVLAGVHMQTYTRLTSMEAANESGRHAVNGILSAENFKGARCRIFDPEDYEPADLKPLLDLDARLFEMGLPHFLDILELRDLPSALLCRQPDLTQLLQLIEKAKKGGVPGAARIGSSPQRDE